MKRFKALLSFVMVIVFAFASLSVSAEVKSGVISGDNVLYLPDEGAIKVNYALTSDGLTAVENAVYSVSVDGIPSEQTAEYAQIDSDGALYVGQLAKGKTLTLSALGTMGADDISASLTVNVSDKIYAEDFEDETVGAVVSGDIFDVKSAIVITEGELTEPVDASKTNKIAKSYTNTSGWYDSETQLVINGNFTSSKLNIEAKIAVQNQADIGGNFPNMNHITRIKYADGAVYTKLSNVNTIQLVNRSGDKWLQSIYGLGGAHYTLMPLHMVITDNTIVDMTVNGKSMESRDISVVKGEGEVIESIAFGSYVDDIEIYSGEKYSGAYEISGQEVICRAPEGTSALFEYAAKADIKCAEADSVTFDLKEAYEGVSVLGNKVKVAGNAPAGAFTLCVKDASGSIVGEKTVTIVSKIYSYADNSGRAYLDFENQTTGEAPNIKLEGRENWIDYVLEFANGKSTFSGVEIAPVVKEDATHGKYISARGFQHWVNDGCNLKIIPRSDNTAYMLSGAECGTIEADYKLDSELMQSISHYYSLLYVGARDNAGFDIRYTEFADGTMGIYSFMTADGYGNNASGGTLLATVPADTWFNLRVEADFVNKTYNLYVNDRLIESGAKHTMPCVEAMYIGADVDNIAVYHGSKDAQIVHSGSSFEGTSTGLSEAYTFETDSLSTVAFNLSETSGNIPGGSSLIVAHYDNNILRRVSIVPVRVSGGVALACATVSGEFAADDYVRAYVWNLETLIPVANVN